LVYTEVGEVMVDVYFYPNAPQGEMFDVYIEILGRLVGSVAELRNLQKEINNAFDNAVYRSELTTTTRGGE